MPKRLSLDTSVLVEYIVRSAPYRDKVAELLEKAAKGDLTLYVSSPVLSETLYIASRIYEAAGEENPNERALEYIYWLKERVKVVEANEDLAIRAGELKKRLGIALTDCYVIAAAQTVEATPLFRRIEREMEPVLTELRRYNVTFLEEV